MNEADPATFYGGGARGYTDYPIRRGRNEEGGVAATADETHGGRQ
jgi:hypothetical protein